MNMNEPNTSIECTVKECAYHCGDCNYCSLNTVRIGAHEPDPTEVRSVDCRSFEVKC